MSGTEIPEVDRRRLARETIWTVDEVFFDHECAALIAEFERMGFEEALITTSRGMVMNKAVRNNDRLILDDPPRAEALWSRVRGV